MKCINDNVRQNLKYIQVQNPQIDLSHFPDFLIVGPQRTGTTWLYYNMRQHPEVFFSKPKEIFFFNLLNMPDFSMYKSNDLGWYLKFFYDNPLQYMWKNMQALKEYGKFYHPKVRGEASASYAAIDLNIIQEIVALNPDIKIILMLRNPIERAWSHAKKYLMSQLGKKYAEISETEFEAFFNEPYNLSCGFYTKMIDNWTACLKEENFFLGYYDDIQKQPEELLTKIWTFLGVSSDLKYNKFARQVINATEAINIPEKYKKLLEDIFREEIQNLNQQFGLLW